MNKTKLGLPRQDGTSMTHRLGKNYIAVPLDTFKPDIEATRNNPGYAIFKRRNKEDTSNMINSSIVQENMK